MFERFTDGARTVVVHARRQAEDAQAAQIEEEHLLSALLTARRSAALLIAAGIDQDGGQGLLAEVARSRRQAGLSALDAQALAGLGIDLDAVVQQVEAQLGDGALGHRPGSRSRWRLPLSRTSKLVLQLGLRQAVARGDRELREEHLLLGLLAARGLAADALGRRGVSVATVSAVLDADRAPRRRAG